jgi:hypothetical protein
MFSIAAINAFIDYGTAAIGGMEKGEGGIDCHWNVEI